MAFEGFIGRAKAIWQERQLAVPDNPVVIEQLLHALSAKTQPLEACLALYHRATKQDQKKWDKVTRTIIERVISPMRAMKPATRSLNIVETRLRKQTFDEYDHTVVAQLGDDPTLALEYKREKVPLERNLFNASERFLVQQPDDVLDALANFTSDQQLEIAIAWEQQPELPWLGILTDADAPIVVDVLLSFPTISHYNPEHDHKTVSLISQRFNVVQRKTAWEKAGQPTGSWPDLYAYLVVASFEQSTTEQIQLLSPEQWAYITVALFAYGEAKVRELWSTDAVLDVKEIGEHHWYGRQTTPSQVLDFVQSLSDVVRAHLPTSPSSGTNIESPSRPGRHISTLDGFQAMPEAIDQFAKALQHVPRESHDALFVVLKKDHYSNSNRWEHVTNEQTAHFIQYVERTNTQDKIQLSIFISQREAFTGERWRNIAQGIRVCQDQALVIPETGQYDLAGHLAVYESAGLPGQQDTNRFWRKCQERSTVFSAQTGSHAKDFRAVERNDGSIRRLQQFAEFHQRYCTADRELVATLLNLTAAEQLVLTQWPDLTADFDLPVIEGTVVSLGRTFSSMDDATQAKLERFTQLTTEQKQRWLWLRQAMLWMGGVDKNPNADLILQLASTAQGEQLQAFIDATGLSGFVPEATLAMLARPDCVGLFYYLNKKIIGFDQQKKIIEHLIALHDAGLPTEYDRSSYQAEGSIVTHGEFNTSVTIGHLLEWDPAQLAEHAKFAVANHLVPFVELLKVSPTISAEQFQRLIRLSAAEHITYLHPDLEIDQSGIDLIEQRSSTVERLTGLALDYSTVNRFRCMTEPAWERLVGNAAILKLYLTGKAGSFPEAALALPDELLLQPEVWAYNYPAKIWASPDKMQMVINLQQRLADAQIEFDERNASWEAWVDAWQKAPWLFSRESLAAFQQGDVLLLPQFASLSESDWTEIRSIMMQYHLRYHNDVVEFIERWKNQGLPSAAQLAELHQTVAVIPWASEERDPNVWAEARVKYLRGQVRADLPTFGQGVNRSVDFWKIVVQLSPAVLHNLEQLAPYARYIHDDVRNLEKFIAIAAHPNFDLAYPLIQQREYILPLRLVDALTPTLVAQLQAWPNSVELDLNHAADFFANPRAEAILAFAQELRQIFGTDFRMSVYDLLIMDVEQDLANVRQLQRECTLPVTPDHLRRLAPVTTGEMQQTITKLLTMFDTGYKIDFHTAVPQLVALDTPLRVATILAKGPGNFGWSILPYRQEFVNALGLTTEQVDELIRACYKNDPTAMPALDIQTAATLLTESSLNTSQKTTRLSDVLEKYVGKTTELIYLVQNDPIPLTLLVRFIVASEFKELTVSTVTEQNWLAAVMAFVRTTIDDHQLPQLNARLIEQVTAAFKSTEVKDLCLAELQKLWRQYLQAGNVERMPIQLTVVTGFVDDCEGAGPMGQFEALSLFIHQFRLALTRASTVERTRQTVMVGVNNMENRFIKERWSDEDKADYYNISRDVLQAAPSLYDDFLVVFQRLSPKDLKRFHERVYPLVRAQLAVLAEPGRQEGEVKFKPRELVKLRQLLRETTDMDTLRTTLVTAMTEKFKTRFGITKIPEQFTAEHVRSLTNSTMYLANMHARNSTKEQLLGWYLALQMNGKWDAYRRGETVDPVDYLTPDKARAVAELMRQREQLSPLTAERLHIPTERVAEFQTLLQTETPTIALGDVETIDVRLGNVIVNLRTLEDLDLYPDPLDKQRMAVLLEYGNKRVGSVAAKLYRGVELAEDERAIRDRMQVVLAEQGLTLTPESIKAHWQDGLKALAVVVNTVRLIEETNAVAEIDTLRGLVQPSAEVIAIFNRLGEEFKVSSGALALTQDLDYLDTIIVKRSDELTEEEVAILREYVGKIRIQVIKLQTAYDQIKAKFANMRQAQMTTTNELLRAKLGQIDAIMQAESAQQTITTTLTHDWNAIVENIRECLSCTKQGCNNDTDLTFGDSNKFFLYSHTEAQRKGSIADQIVFLTPTTSEHAGAELSFVLDRVYGKCTPFILTNHIATVFKKYRLLKKSFPESALSIFVTDAALSTGGLSSDQLATRLQEQFGREVLIERAEVEVDIAQSAAGDHYVEFGGDSRTSGKRTVSGLVLHTA